jgi:hypothetical protein
MGSNVNFDKNKMGEGSINNPYTIPSGKYFAVGNFIQVVYRAPHPKISKLTFDALIWA